MQSECNNNNNQKKSTRNRISPANIDSRNKLCARVEGSSVALDEKKTGTMLQPHCLLCCQAFTMSWSCNYHSTTFRILIQCFFVGN